MHRGVKERKQAEHSSETYQAEPPAEVSQRTDGQRDDQETQCPDSSGIADIFEWIGAELPLDGRYDEQDQRRETSQKDDRLEQWFMSAHLEFGHFWVRLL
jgi:hypothetical protein